MKANDPNANQAPAHSANTHDAKASNANAHDANAKNATRRSFLKKGALLAVPLAAATAPAAIVADDSLKSRLARLEDEAAIRNLHAAWLRQFNAADAKAAAHLMANSKSAASSEILRRIAPDHAAAPDAVDVASDGRSASGRCHCVVEIEAPIARDSTLAQMAHAQGSGFLRRTERRVLRVTYAKSSGAWSIASAELEPA
jgi:hypothetical protein